MENDIKFRIKLDGTVEITEGGLFAIINLANGNRVAGNYEFVEAVTKQAIAFGEFGNPGDMRVYKTPPTAEEVAASIIAEIEEDKTLLACTSFGELHDYCDANMLGNSAELLYMMSCNDAIDILDPAQDLVNEFLVKRNASRPTALAGFTPGPWTLSEKRPEAVISGDGNYIADCGVSIIIPPAEQTANAHLIAAAPDLLAALEALVKESGRPLANLDPDISGHGPLFAAYVAIAKARGGAA